MLEILQLTNCLERLVKRFKWNVDENSLFWKMTDNRKIKNEIIYFSVMHILFNYCVPEVFDIFDN